MNGPGDTVLGVQIRTLIVIVKGVKPIQATDFVSPGMPKEIRTVYYPTSVGSVTLRSL